MQSSQLYIQQAVLCRWYFDFNQLYIGAGFLMPHHIVASMMFGAVISWGLMWPVCACLQLLTVAFVNHVPFFVPLNTLLCLVKSVSLQADL